MAKGYDTIAALWHSFYLLMRNSGQDDDATEEQPGLPGTGGHVVSAKQGSNNNNDWWNLGAKLETVSEKKISKVYMVRNSD